MPKLQNYLTREDPHLGMTILDAILATCAEPPHFLPFSKYHDGVLQYYVSGSTTLANPIEDLISSAYSYFKHDTRVACILSIGAGHPGATPLPSKYTISNEIQFRRKFMQDGEKRARKVMARMGHLPLYTRLSVAQEFQGSSLCAWDDLEPISVRTQEYLESVDTGDAIERAVENWTTHDGPATLEQLRGYLFFLLRLSDKSTGNAGGGLIAPLSIPALTPRFVDRPKEMNDLVNKMSQNNDQQQQIVVVVSGLAGSGKTTLVLKYLYDNADRFVSHLYPHLVLTIHRYQSRFIIDGSTEDSIRADITRHVRSQSIEYSQYSYDDAFRYLFQPTNRGRLLVFDSVDDPKLELGKFIPPCLSVSVIITTQDPTRSQLTSCVLDPSHRQIISYGHVELHAMSHEESITLLDIVSERQHTFEEHTDVDSIVDSLGYHPLALVQAGSYIARTGKRWNEYRRTYEENRAELMDQRAHHQRVAGCSSVYTTFDISYNALPLQARHVLHFLSFFSRLNFPLEMIREAAQDGFRYESHYYLDRGSEFQLGVNKLKELFYNANGEWNETHLDSIIVTLRSYSFITVTQATPSSVLEMHSLIQSWAQDRLLTEQVNTYVAAVIRLSSYFSKCESGPMIDILIPQLLHLTRHWNVLHVNDKMGFSVVLYKGSHFKAAAELGNEVLETLKNSTSTSTEQLISVSDKLAAVLETAEDYIQALQLKEETLKMKKEWWGDLHLGTINAIADLVWLYYKLQRFGSATKKGEELVELRKIALGENNPATIAAMSNLFELYMKMGRQEDALEIQTKIWEKYKGQSHADAIKAYSRLAKVNYSLQRHKEAAGLYEEVLRTQKWQPGGPHLDMVCTLSNLGECYHCLGDHNKALTHRTRLVDLLKEERGEQDPETLKATEMLAKTYYSLKRYTEAGKLEHRIVNMRRQALPLTNSTEGNTSRIYKKEKRMLE